MNSKLDVLNKIYPLSTENDWKLVEDNNNYVIHSKEEGALNYTRGEGDIVRGVGEVTDFIRDISKINLYDEMYASGSIIESFGQYKINYLRYKGGLTVADRDFCGISSTLKRNGLTYIVLTSIPGHDKCPLVKGVVRAEVEVGGWILKELNKNRTKSTYVVCSDPKGSLPAFIKTWSAKL